MVIEGLAALSGSIQGGTMKAIAVGSPERLKGFPDLPAAAEVLPGFNARGWAALVAPVGTPAPIVDKVSEALRKVVGEPEVQGKLAVTGSYVRPMTPAQVMAFIQADQQMWKPILERIARRRRGQPRVPGERARSASEDLDGEKPTRAARASQWRCAILALGPGSRSARASALATLARDTRYATVGQPQGGEVALSSGEENVVGRKEMWTTRDMRRLGAAVVLAVVAAAMPTATQAQAHQRKPGRSGRCGSSCRSGRAPGSTSRRGCSATGWRRNGASRW